MDARFRNHNSLPPTDNIEKQKTLVGEIDSPINNTNNRAKRRLELEQLKQDLDEGFITPEEYEREKQKIFLQYPL